MFDARLRDYDSVHFLFFLNDLTISSQQSGILNYLHVMMNNHVIRVQPARVSFNTNKITKVDGGNMSKIIVTTTIKVLMKTG